MLKTQEAVLARTQQVDLAMYPGINTAKAVLIFLVIIAHCLPPGMIQYYNYFFEMPLFMAISGFLLKESVFKTGLSRYMVRLTKRLLIPWSIAVVVYLPFQLGNRPFRLYAVEDILYPFFHLWFVPAYVLGAIVSFAIVRKKVPLSWVLVASGVFTCVWYVLFRDNPETVEVQPLFLMGDKRLYSYLFFFIVGFALRNGLLNIRPQRASLLFIIISSFILVAICVENAMSSQLTVLPYLFFNFSLSVFVLHYLAPLRLINSSILDFINRQSLGMYLIHPLVMFGIFHLLNDPAKQSINMFQGAAIGLITIVITVFIVKAVESSSFLNRVVLGKVENEKK